MKLSLCNHNRLHYFKGAKVLWRVTPKSVWRCEAACDVSPASAPGLGTRETLLTADRRESRATFSYNPIIRVLPRCPPDCCCIFTIPAAISQETPRISVKQFWHRCTSISQYLEKPSTIVSVFADKHTISDQNKQCLSCAIMRGMASMILNRDIYCDYINDDQSLDD